MAPSSAAVVDTISKCGVEAQQDVREACERFDAVGFACRDNGVQRSEVVAGLLVAGEARFQSDCCRSVA